MREAVGDVSVAEPVQDEDDQDVLDAWLDEIPVLTNQPCCSPPEKANRFGVNFRERSNQTTK